MVKPFIWSSEEIRRMMRRQQMVMMLIIAERWRPRKIPWRALSLPMALVVTV
jgi:hypothetical protein